MTRTKRLAQICASRLPKWWDGSWTVMLIVFCLAASVFVVSVTLGTLQYTGVIP